MVKWSVYLCLSGMVAVLGAYRSSFFGQVEADSFLYTSINLPAYATSHEISIWAETEDLDPIVLLRYDGLPTMDNYDAKFQVSQLPSKLRIIDNEPTQGVLYLALYGGAIINQYRYFAGSPSQVLVGIESIVESCDDAFERGANCSSVEQLSTGSTTTATVSSTAPQYYSISVPGGAEEVSVAIQSDSWADALCGVSENNASSTVWRLSGDLYLDQPGEDSNAVRRSVVLNTTGICTNHASSAAVDEIALQLTAPRPLPGLWTLRLQVQAVHNVSHEVNHRSAHSESQRQHNGMHRKRLTARTVASMHNAGSLSVTGDGPTVAVVISTTVALSISTTISNCRKGTTGAADQGACVVPVREMSAQRTFVDGSAERFSLLGSDVPFPATEMANSTDSYVVFSADLPTKAREIIVGGGMVVQLRVSAAPGSDTKVSGDAGAGSLLNEFLDSIEFSAAVRVGGYPNDPYASLESELSEEEAFAPNAFVLWSQDAQVVDSGAAAHQSSDDDEGDDQGGLGPAASTLVMASKGVIQHVLAVLGIASKPHASVREQLRESSGAHSTSAERRYSWSVARAALPNLFTPWPGMTSGAAPMYIRVSARQSAANATGASSIDLRNLSVALSVVFVPCPEGSCAHGTCYTRRQGDIAASTCYCRYPWAGERCDTLVMPYGYYVAQILLLVMSNVAMVPAVLLSARENFAFVAALLGMSASSSAVYHLCDTDVYCLGGLSFYSLQVLDVLMSVASISSILLLYAPVSRKMHSALSLLCIGLLVAMVSNAPTSPANVAVAGVFAVLSCVVGWLCVRGADRKDRRANRSIDGGNHGVCAKRRAPVYSALAQGQAVDDSVRGGMDVEMVSTSGRIEGQWGSGVAEVGDVSEGDVWQPTGDGGAWVSWAWDSRLRLPAAGLALGVVGLSCFALQGRDNYYLFHSLWHVLMMVSAYLLVRGRVEMSDCIYCK